MSDTQGKEIQKADDKPKPPSLGQELASRAPAFLQGLPKHIPVERYTRVVMTAIQNNPKLWQADRASLWNACMKAAQDGLLPDGREGALVIYSTKMRDPDGGRDVWIDKVQWMVMVAGIRKKARNSGEIATWDVQAVHSRDLFDYELGDDPFIRHKPYLGTEPRGDLIAVYSICTLKSGEKTRDVMSAADVLDVRDKYAKKDRNGNFSQAWQKSLDEMAKKTVARRHSKVLPMSTDLDELMRGDDALYNLEGASDKKLPKVDSDVGNRLDKLIASVSGVADPEPDHDPETGEIIDNETGKQVATEETRSSVDREAKAGLADDKGGDKKPAADQSAQGADKEKAASTSKDAGGEKTAATKAPTQKELVAEGTDASERGSNTLRVFLRRFEEKEGDNGAEKKFGRAQIKAWFEEADKADRRIAKEEADVEAGQSDARE